MTCTWRGISQGLMAASAILLSTGCDAATGLDPADAPIMISPVAPSLTALGETMQLAVVSGDASRMPVSNCTSNWNSLSPSIVAVDSGGTITAKQVGVALIAATCGGAADTVTVNVSQVVDGVEISTPILSAEVGDTAFLAAIAKDANGHTVKDAVFTWASSNPSVAVVDTAGVVVGVDEGSTTIVARSGDASGSAAVAVASGQQVPAPIRSLGELVVFPNPAVEFIIGPQLRSGSTSNPWQWFDTNATSHADKLWGADGVGLLERSHGYYYDAALVQYTNYYRTGDSEALERARTAADHWYANSIVEKSKYSGYNPREAALGGLMLRALDGKPEYWPFITAEVERHYATWLGKRLTYPTLYFGVRDGGYALLYTAQLARAHPDPALRAVFESQAVSAARDYYARLQNSDGAWYWKDDGSETKPGGVWEQPFMVGLLLEGMIATHQLTQDSEVKQAIVRGVEHLWSTYRLDDIVPEARGQGVAWRHVPYFVYTDGTYNAEEHLAGATELREGWDTNTIREGRQRNSLVVHAFGYAYYLTGDPKYREWGDEIFAATYGKGQGPLADAFSGLADYRGKEYNQAYRSAGHYLVWRLGK